MAARELWLASHARGLAGLGRRGAVKAARHDLALLSLSQQQRAQRVERLTVQERQLRRHEQQRAAWVETHEAAATVDSPPWLAGLLGEVPDSTRGRRRWQVTAIGTTSPKTDSATAPAT